MTIDALVHDEAEPIGLAIGSGSDPVFAAIAASRGSALAERGFGAAVLIERPGSPVPLLMTEAGSGVAILEAAIRARRSAGSGSADGDASGRVMVQARPEQAPTTNGHGPRVRAARGSSGGSGGGRRRSTSERGGWRSRAARASTSTAW